jgi:AmpD protein
VKPFVPRSKTLLQVDAGGRLVGIPYLASPNCDDRPPGARIRLLVIHNISLPPDVFGGPGIIQLFTNTLQPGEHPYYATLHELRVSAHFLIRRDGSVVQFVPCLRRAWHAGVSEWRGHRHCNDFSVGIELEGSDRMPFESAQYNALVRVSEALRTAYPIEDIVGHSEIAAGRKTDPGPCFDWIRYRGELER